MQPMQQMNAQLEQMMQPMQQFNQLIGPMQQFGTMMIDGMERLTDYQLEMMQTYTHFTASQVRDALEVHDARSLRDYFEKQTRATEQLGRKMAEDTQQLMSMGQQAASEGLRVIRSGSEQATDMAQHGMQQGAEQMQEGAQQARQAAGGGNGSLPIDRYDELTIGEIEQRLDNLDKDSIRQLADYERKHKNRKTLNDAFERRL